MQIKLYRKKHGLIIRTIPDFFMCCFYKMPSIYRLIPTNDDKNKKKFNNYSFLVLKKRFICYYGLFLLLRVWSV